MLKNNATVIWISMLTLVLIVISGCVTKEQEPQIVARRVDLAEFADRSTVKSEPETVQESTASESTSHSTNGQGENVPFQLGAGSSEVEAALRALERENPEPPTRSNENPVNDRFLIDSLVGQINGRPIFANEILLPIEDQLLAISRRVDSIDEFSKRAKPIIYERTFAVVRNELILSEAETSLSAEQQQGLLFFLRNLKEEEVAKRGGTREEAERRLLDEEGLSLDEKVELEKETALIQNTMSQKVRSRVIVSWHDIEREYKRRFDEFNPPQQVTLARIRLDESNLEQIEDVKARLRAGEDFGDVAQHVGMNDRGAWDTFIVGIGGISDIPINDTYKPYLEGLVEGDVTEAFEARGRIMWLQVRELMRPEGRSLYDQDVQEFLRRSIYGSRMRVEQERYMQNLMEKSTVDDLDVMATRIFEIAMIRYSP